LELAPQDLIEGLDGIDNGVSQYPADMRPAYKDSTNLPARVGRLNPNWNETGVDLDVCVQASASCVTGETKGRLRLATAERSVIA
jgi:uncharacterized UPF0160 family protein